MTTKQFRWFYGIAILLAITFVWVTSVRAEWPDFSCRAMRADLIWQDWARRHCSHRWHHWRGYHKPAPDPAIMSAQLRLQQLGYEIDVDGFIGPETRDALLRFQVDNDLKATGELDRATKYVLHETEGPTSGKQSWFKGPPKICPERRGSETRHCACEPIQVTTGEHLWKDGKSESMKRWKGAVRSSLGELFLGWKHAADKVDICWHSGTGERTVDRHVRCMRQARPCWGILESGDTDEFEVDVPRGGKE